jgi:transposase
MNQNYYLGLDAAKHKVRVALRGSAERVLLERDLPVSGAGRRELLALLGRHLPGEAKVLVLIEATGILHLHWAAALSKAGHSVAVINPLMARRLYRVKNSLRENKTDPIDARQLCALAARDGTELLAKYRFHLAPARCALQRLQSVRQSWRHALTNLKKTYGSLLDLSFPELGGLLEIDGVGIRALLLKAPTPKAIARLRLSTLEKDWKLRPKARALKALAADSMADPELAQASAPALVALLQSMAQLEARLLALDRQIQHQVELSCPAQTKALLQTLPGFGPVIAANVIAHLPEEILQSGSNRTAATRLQAFMGNDPRLKQSGQWQGQTKMSKRGVEMLRTSFFQAAFSASVSNPELKAFYQRQRARGKCHHVALSHLMRILTRRLVAVLRSAQPYDPNYQHQQSLKKAA